MDRNAMAISGKSATDTVIIEQALAELEFDDDDAVVEEPIAELSSDEERVLGIQIAKTEAYASVKPEAAVEAAPVAATGTAAKPVKVAKAKKAPMVRDLNALPADLFILTDDSGLDGDAWKADTIKKIPVQKKIAEKFENIFVAMNARKAPSKYVVDIFRVLNAKKTVTSTELVAALMAMNSNRGAVYAEGTARSQTGQIMQLFQALNIAVRRKNTLTLRDDSLIAKYLAKHI